MNHSRINAKNITTQAHIYYYRFLCTYMVNCVQNISVYVYECVFVFIYFIDMPMYALTYNLYIR